MKADLPVNEALRLQALHSLAILDTPREQNFDDVAHVAMQLCDVPISVISLIDTDRQWFKSCLGLEGTETPRDIAFCAHAILSPDDITYVEDARLDARFADNELVIGEPYIRFYAGAPLVTENGYALGTLCVVDYQPRRLSSGQVDALKALARQVMQLLRLKATNEVVQEHAARVQLIADNVPVLLGELNPGGRYNFLNKKYRDWLGVDPRSSVGKTPQDIFPAPLSNILTLAIEQGLSGLPASAELALEAGRVLDIHYFPRFEAGKLVALIEVANDITERNLHTKIIQHERARLEAIIEGTNIGTWEWDVISGDVVVNERWAKMLGYLLEDLAPITVESWRQLIHPDDLTQAQLLLAKHFSGEADFYDCQYRMRRKDGEWHWVRTNGKIVARNPLGEPAIVSGMHIDISEIKSTYNRLKEREDLLRSMLSNFPGAAYRCENNANWTMRYLSKAVEQLTGYAAADFIGDVKITFTAITHPSDIQRVNDLVQAALATGEPFDIEYRIQRADGQWRHVREIGRGVYGAKGELECIDGFIWDVQARHDSEHEKRVMANKMAQLFEMAPIGIMQVDETGHLLEANPEFCKLIGYSQEELRALTFLDLTPDEDWERSTAATNEIKSQGRFGPLEKNYLTKDGELISVEISGALINPEEGDSQCWWTLVKDIREQKHMERMKNEFISTVSHELRTPLTSISGALGLVTGSMLGVLPQKAQNMLEIAYKNSQRLTVLINDLLDMEKLLAGKMYFDMKIQPLAPLIEQALIENKSYADKYAVRYQLHDLSKGVSIKVDSLRLQQVLSNLFSNAAKYSRSDDVVDITLQEHKGWVRISVQDYGAGIPLEFRDRIFQKFSQADATDSRQKGGTGLGLAISKELVERMGGRIGFDSEPGSGSHFFAEFRKEVSASPG